MEVRLTIYEFIELCEKKGGDASFFQKENLKKRKERVSHMQVLRRTAFVSDHWCYVVSTMPRNASHRRYYYFDRETLKPVTTLDMGDYEKCR